MLSIFNYSRVFCGFVPLTLTAFLTLITLSVWQFDGLLTSPKHNSSVAKADDSTNITNSFIKSAVPDDTLNSSTDEQTRTKVIESYGKLPLHFEPNEGQVDSNEVKFTSRGDGYNLFLSSTNAKLVLSRPIAATEKDNLQNKGKTILDRELLKKEDLIKQNVAAQPREQSVIEMSLVGANNQSEAKAIEELEGKSNYFVGNDESKWRTNVANFKKVRFEEVYSGIDIEYYGNRRQLEYDFIVEPNADPDQIKLNFDGVENIKVNEEGELVLETKTGEKIKQKKPIIYQTEETGERTEVEGSYKIEEGKEVRFEIGEYDRSKQLTIDPIVLVYSTYLGGMREEGGSRIVVDSQGNAYITGHTNSVNFPIINARQTTSGNYFDVFITKINSSGNALIYSTYIGGNGFEFGRGIAVDSAGNAYITGDTTSTNFPVENAIQPTLGGIMDTFLTKISPTGNALVYSTYFGGNDIDYGVAVAVDFGGNVYITGNTYSTNFPVVNAKQAVSGGTLDAFVTKINPIGNAPIYSTYLGGSEQDASIDIAVDSAGNAYITGDTFSTNFPVENARQQTYSGGPQDAFITKINSSGSAFVYSTYLGGDSIEYSGGIAVDSDGNTYVTGSTLSENFPIANAIQSRIGGWHYDAFVTKLNPTGSAYIYSTYLGGTDSDGGSSIATDIAGNAYIIGSTSSSNFPVFNALQPSFTQGNVSFDSDVFVTKLNSSGSRFAFSTYFGGMGRDYGSSIALGNDGYIYLTGSTQSQNFPVINAIQPSTGQVGESIESCKEIYYPNFSSTIGLQLNGSATRVNDVLRLTPAQYIERGSAWFKTKKTLKESFHTSFDFQMTNGHAEGFTFTIQNSPEGSAALGGDPSCGSCLGYTGITNSVSIQFDAFRNELRVATNGSFNSIASTTQIPDLNDGLVHNAFIQYFQQQLYIDVDNIQRLVVPLNINDFGLDNGNAYVGFTAATGDLSAGNENHDILDWVFGVSCNFDAFISKLAIPTSSISGQIVTVSGRPLDQVQLNSSGDTFNKTVSDNDGNYLIDLIEGNNHTFAPSFSTHRFSPPAYSFSPLMGNQSGVNFTAALINDNFADAAVLTGAFGTVVGNNQDATRQTAEPAHAGQSGNKSVWYRIRSTTTGQAAISTYGSSFDTTLAVYTGTNLNNLTLVSPDAANDDAAIFDQTSRVTFPAVAGTDYWIAVDGKQPGQSDNFKLNYYTTSLTVSGVVTRDRVPQPNLIVRATSTDNTVAYTTTQSNGRYSLPVPAGSYTFAVLNQNSVQQGQAVTLYNLSADQTLNIELLGFGSEFFNAIGSVRLPENGTSNGLKVEFEGPNTGTCLLQDNATRFVCSGLVPGGSYVIKITSPYYEFSPNEFSLNNVQSNFLNLKFEAAHRITGKVVNGANGVFNATVLITGNTPNGRPINATTNAAGEYIASVPTGYNYTVTPSLTGLAFSPPKSDFTNLNNHQIADFSVVNSCSDQSYSVNPTSSITVPAEGTESLIVNLTTSQNCSWTASSNEQWITVNQSNRSGTGSRAVSFFVYPNPALVSRTATITLAGKTVTIVQESASDIASSSVSFDFDGDGKSDIGVFRPSAGSWYLQQSTAGFAGVVFGLGTDLITPADFDGDGRTDIAVFRPENGTWYYLHSSTGIFNAIQFGQAGDIPLPADFDGDGRADINVFRPSIGGWYRLNSSNGEFFGINFGQQGDIPLAADFDGDGKSDIAVFRPGAGTFYWLNSSNGQFNATQFGLGTDKPTPADFDGDNRADIAVFRPENGAWYWLNSSNGEFVGIGFGQNGDKPVAADYDGDGRADIAVFREGTWYLQQSQAGFSGVAFGLATDTPIANAFVP